MATAQVNPTRMELSKLKKRLATARRGHKLLKDKRDELMKIFLDAVRENKTLREQVEASVERLHASFTVAAAVTSREVLEESLIYPRNVGELEITYKNVMSVLVPQYEYRTKNDSSDLYSYGFAFTTGELDSAVGELSRALPEILKLAQTEKKCQMLADEIEKTRRRVNALEYIMIPQLETGIRTIKMKLDENERGNTTRLMKVKSMMVEQQLLEQRRYDEEQAKAKKA